MTKNLITLSPDQTVSEAAKFFEKEGKHHVPIMHNEKMVGIVSKSDYLFFKRGFLDDKTDQRIEEIRMNNYELRDIMTRDFQSIQDTDTIGKALEVFQKNVFHALPVMKDEHLVGLITTFDVIQQILYENEAHAS